MSPDGQRPGKYKAYYDVLSYIATQMAFCFTTAPFVLLRLPDSMLVWARVYFYVVIGVAACLAFFTSPGKAWLNQRAKARSKEKTRAENMKRGQKEPLLGLPEDPGRDVDEAVNEIKQEVELRQRKGSKIEMPTGDEMRKVIEEKLGKKAA